MTILSYYPLTIVRDIDGSGKNWPFFAIIDPKALFPASIFAQEVVESRSKSLRILLGIALGAVLWAALGPLYSVLGPLAGVVAARMWRQRLELRGQATECAVRVRFYDMDRHTAVALAAVQLTKYDQFDGWSQDKIYSAILAELEWADRWVMKHRGKLEEVAKSF